RGLSRLIMRRIGAGKERVATGRNLQRQNTSDGLGARRNLSAQEFFGALWTAQEQATAFSAQKGSLINGRLELGAGLETHALRRRNGDFLAGGRIAAFARGAGLDGESAESDEANFFAALQRLGDRANHGVQRVAGSGFGSFRRFRDVV